MPSTATVSNRVCVYGLVLAEMVLESTTSTPFASDPAPPQRQ